MANQYQIYEASLTAMCNMYRMANDSNEPIAIGELANKIRNYHKDPVYPEGCSIINDIFIWNRGAATSFQLHTLSERPSQATKSSIDGTADCYQYVDSSTHIYHLYTDSSLLYAARHADLSLSDILNLGLDSIINFKFYRGRSAWRAGMGFFYGGGSIENTSGDFNFLNFPNVRNIYYFSSEQVENIGIDNLINNTKIERGFGPGENFTCTPKYMTQDDYYSMYMTLNHPIINFPSSVTYLRQGTPAPYNSKNLDNFHPEITIQSPYLNTCYLGYYPLRENIKPYNIKMCDDLVIGRSDGAWLTLFEHGQTRDYEGIKNIYIIPYSRCMSNLNFAAIDKDIEINFRPYNNGDCMIITDTFLEDFIVNTQHDASLNFQGDLYLQRPRFFGTDTPNLYNYTPKKLAQFKNIYAHGTCMSQLFIEGYPYSHQNSCSGPNLTLLQEGIYIENFKSEGDISLYFSPSRPPSNYNFDLLTVNGVIYCGKHYNTNYYDYNNSGSFTGQIGMWSREGYKLKVYAENTFSITQAAGSGSYSGELDDNFFIDAPMKGDYYYWANGSTGNDCSLYINIGRNTKMNIHIKRGSLGDFQSASWGSGFPRLLAQDYDPAHNHSGYAYTLNFTRISSGHYSDPYGRLHIYEYDTCPFEVNKNIPYRERFLYD